MTQEMTATIQSVFKEIKKTDSEIDPDSSLYDLGLDSLEMIDALYELEDRTGVRIPPEFLETHEKMSVNDLREFIENSL
jgi:acyl carrier protein